MKYTRRIVLIFALMLVLMTSVGTLHAQEPLPLLPALDGSTASPLAGELELWWSPSLYVDPYCDNCTDPGIRWTDLNGDIRAFRYRLFLRELATGRVITPYMVGVTCAAGFCEMTSRSGFLLDYLVNRYQYELWVEAYEYGVYYGSTVKRTTTALLAQKVNITSPVNNPTVSDARVEWTNTNTDRLMIVFVQDVLTGKTVHRAEVVLTGCTNGVCSYDIPENGLQAGRSYRVRLRTVGHNNVIANSAWQRFTFVPFN